MAGASKDLDLQSKIFDQILSMPIAPSNGSHRSETAVTGEGSNHGTEPNLLAQGNGTPTAGNLVDNKEILSFQTKPANMSMSMKNENSDRKTAEATNKVVRKGALLRDSKA